MALNIVTNSKIRTIAREGIWLLGKPIDHFAGTKLPSQGEVLRVVFYLHQSESELKPCIKKTAEMLQEVWDKAKIPTITTYRIIDRISKLHQRYYALRKSSARTTGKALEDRSIFSKSLNDILDVAHPEAEKLIKCKEDRDFLESQRRPGREGSMLGVDKIWCKKMAYKERRIEQANRRRQSALGDDGTTPTTSKFMRSSVLGSNLPSASDCSSNFPKHPEIEKLPLKRPRHIITSKVAASLDRTQISDRQASHLLIPFASELGHDVRNLALSATSIRRQRVAHRKNMADEIKESFSPTVPLTLHWDGKLMSDLTGREIVDRLPILVSGDGMQKILAVPKLPDGKAEATALVIEETLAEWNLKDQISSLCFDTTAVNTGAKSGVCLRLEMMLDKPLLYLACRHHVFEILLQAVFSTVLIEQPKGPEFTLFQSFRNMWPQIDKTKYTTAVSDHTILQGTESWCVDVIQFCQNLLREKQPRDDYKEFLQLTIIFLGSIPENSSSVRFRAPGAMHRARWMARAIYALKIWMFFDQFEKLQHTRSSLRESQMRENFRIKLTDFCLFIVRYYVQAWFYATSAAAAPRIDLTLMKKLNQHTNKAIKSAGTSALSRHLWYLSEVTVGLALFDDGVSDMEKKIMVQRINDVEGSEEPTPRLHSSSEDVAKKCLPEFFTSTTKKLLQHLKIDSSFLTVDPTSWKTTETYIQGKQRVSRLLVTNDAAERGVAMIHEFTKKGRTKTEDQLQAMVQIVEEHRRMFPSTANKRALLD